MSDFRDNGPAGGGGGPRKPRIEVLRGTATPAPSEAPAAEPARTHAFGGPAEREPHNYAAIPPQPVTASRAEYAHPVERRRGGGLLRSPVLLVALLALAVLIGAIWYASMQREPQVVFDVGDEGTRPAAKEMPADSPVYDDAAPDGAGDEAPREAEAAPRDPAPSLPALADAEDTAAPPIAEPRTPPVKEAPADDAAPSGATSAVETVRAFYGALSAGDGGSAAQFVVPAKRRSGPLSAGALTRYYSSFRRPLRVRRVTPVDADTVRVAYDYVLADGRECRGTAAVDVVQSGDGGLVSGIRTQGPC